MSSVLDKLRILMEGGVLLEADDDNKYSINDDGTPAQPDNTDAAAPATSEDQTGNADGADTGDGGGDEPATTDGDNADGPDAGGDYTIDGGDDDTGDGGDGDQPATTDGGGDGSAPATDPNQPKPGEVLNIDPKTRAILAYKNFDRYRDLRDDTVRLITELSEFVPTNDEVRAVVGITIERSTDLVNKLNDYILYKYSDTSYEMNYYNFMQFIVEKRYLDELYDKIIKTSSQATQNK